MGFEPHAMLAYMCHLLYRSGGGGDAGVGDLGTRISLDDLKHLLSITPFFQYPHFFIFHT